LLEFLVIFRVFFVPSKQFLHFLELFLALKINSKKTNRNGPSPKARPVSLRPGPTRQPTKAHSGVDPGRGQCPWRTRPGVHAAAAGFPCATPIKGSNRGRARPNPPPPPASRAPRSAAALSRAGPAPMADCRCLSSIRPLPSFRYRR
jgi:hypothetical protein